MRRCLDLENRFAHVEQLTIKCEAQANKSDIVLAKVEQTLGLIKIDQKS